MRLIHAKEPGPNFKEDFDRFPILYDGLERVLCPRVHFKMMVFDGEEAYIGSANLTGAGIGMKGDDTRNFEAGILTDEHEIVEQAMNQFDEVWMGKLCKTCKRKDFCPDPKQEKSDSENLCPNPAHLSIIFALIIQRIWRLIVYVYSMRSAVFVMLTSRQR